MIYLCLVNIDKEYRFYEEYETIGGAINRLKTLVHSTRITCIDYYDTNGTPLPPQFMQAFHSQRYCADNMIEFGNYPLYINIKEVK